MPARPDPPLRRRRRQRWLLTVLGLVFAVSALLRLGGLEAAFADIGSEAPAGSGTVAPDLARSLQDALAEIAALRLTLELRDAALADRARAVAAAEALVQARLAELEAAETRLAALIATSDAAAETDLDRLTRVYETMAPEEAAAVFAQMQPSFAAGFLARMSPAASATLMAALSPEQAYAVSVIIATRNSSAPRMAPPDLPATTAPDTEN